MTCCEEDIRFFGFLCKYDRARTLKKGQWVMCLGFGAGLTWGGALFQW